MIGESKTTIRLSPKAGAYLSRLLCMVFVEQGVTMPLGPNTPIANRFGRSARTWPPVAFKLTKGDVDEAVKPDGLMGWPSIGAGDP
jgi:hypothetical protein